MKTNQKFWYRWMLNYSFGELMGIGAAAGIGRFLFIGLSNTASSQSSTSLITFAILVSAGAAEGFIIGYVQWKSLSKMVLHFRPAPWVLVTIFFTVSGWLLILPPAVLFISFLTKITLISNYYSVLYTALAGMAFGGLIGMPQFLIIKKFYKNGVVWILANAFGWALSFLIMYSAMSMITSATSYVYSLSLVIISCVLSGLVQGIVTGTSLHFLMSVKPEHARKVVDNGLLIDL